MEINELEDIFKLKLNHLHYLGVGAVVYKYLKTIGKKTGDNMPHKTTVPLYRIYLHMPNSYKKLPPEVNIYMIH